MQLHTKRCCPLQSIISGPSNANITPVCQKQEQSECDLEFILESFPYSIPNPTDSPLCKLEPLSVKGYKSSLEKHLDKIYGETILSIIICRARIGYYRLKQKIITGNLPSATNDPNTLTKDLENEITTDQLTKVGTIGDYFISSPLGLAPTKWRKIHHLLYPCGRSVNYHIPKELEALEYTTFNKAKQEVIQVCPDNIMIKRDFKNVF